MHVNSQSLIPVQTLSNLVQFLPWQLPPETYFHTMRPVGQNQVQLKPIFRSSPCGGTSWTSRQLQCFAVFIRMQHRRRSLWSTADLFFLFSFLYSCYWDYTSADFNGLGPVAPISVNCTVSWLTDFTLLLLADVARTTVNWDWCNRPLTNNLT